MGMAIARRLAVFVVLGIALGLMAQGQTARVSAYSPAAVTVGVQPDTNFNVVVTLQNFTVPPVSGSQGRRAYWGGNEIAGGIPIPIVSAVDGATQFTVGIPPSLREAATASPITLCQRIILGAGTIDGACTDPSVSAQFMVNAAPTFTIGPTLPIAVQDVPYQVQLSVTGGTPGSSENPYNWEMTGSLPAELSFNEKNGIISGTPTAPQTISVTVVARDQYGIATTPRTFSLTVNPPLSITTTSLPPATAGSPYTASLAATGGRPSNTWSAAPSLSTFGLSLNSATGAITGTPTQAGEITFTAQVSDSYTPPNSASRQFTIVVGSPLQITTTSPLPQATQDSPFTLTFTATGNVGAPVWEVDSGALPPGLNLSASTGTLGGTPTASGTFSFTVRVRDQQENSATRSFLLEVLAALTVTSGPQLPQGSVGTAYTAALLASGGVAPYSWALVSAGTLPPGLNLSSGGSISGTPTEAGSFSPVVRVTDSAGATAERTLGLTIAPELVISTDAVLPQAGAQQAYSVPLVASGGAPPYSWSVAPGSTLPVGLSLAPSSGVLSGVPTQLGTFSFAVRVTDTRGVFAQRSFSLVVGSGFVITTGAVLPVAFAGADYSASIAVAGGQAPYTWMVGEGSNLPPGLSLNAETGLLSGMPASTGSFSFMIRAEDSAEASAERTFQLQVVEALRLLTVELPNGSPGEPYPSITLQATGGTPPYAFRLASGASLPPGLMLNASGVISGTPPAEGDFSFTVVVSDAEGREDSRDYRILVQAGLQFTTPGLLPPATTGVPVEIQLMTSGGVTPVTFALAGAELPPGLSLSTTGSLSGTPEAPGDVNFTVRATDSGAEPQVAERSFTLRIADPVVLVTEVIPAALVDENYGQGIEVQGGAGGFVFGVVEGQLPEGISLSSNGFLSGVPVALGASSITIRVTDQDGRETTRGYTLNVVPVVITAVAISPETSAPDPNEQQSVGVQIPEAVSAALQGELILSFIPATDPPVDDPAVQFVSGGRRVTFALPAGSTDGQFADGEQSPPFQTGTVAGEIVLSVKLTSSGVDVTPTPTPTAIVPVPAAAPVISDLEVNRNGNQLTVVVRGFSTPRAMTNAALSFTARAGSNISGALSFTVDLAPVFTVWYGSEASNEHGSRFRLTLPVTISGDAADITGLSIRLRNQNGESNSVSATF